MDSYVPDAVGVTVASGGMTAPSPGAEVPRDPGNAPEPRKHYEYWV